MEFNYFELNYTFERSRTLSYVHTQIPAELSGSFFATDLCSDQSAVGDPVRLESTLPHLLEELQGSPGLLPFLHVLI